MKDEGVMPCSGQTAFILHPSCFILASFISSEGILDRRSTLRSPSNPPHAYAPPVRPRTSTTAGRACGFPPFLLEPQRFYSVLRKIMMKRIAAVTAVCSLFAVALLAGGLSKYKGWDKSPQGYL